MTRVQKRQEACPSPSHMLPSIKVQNLCFSLISYVRFCSKEGSNILIMLSNNLPLEKCKLALESVKNKASVFIPPIMDCGTQALLHSIMYCLPTAPFSDTISNVLFCFPHLRFKELYQHACLLMGTYTYI